MSGAPPRVPARVLVTRPEPGATMTAGRLETMGFRPVKLPLQEIRPLAVPPGVVLEGIAAVVVTSANAIRHARPELVAALADLPCFTVGEATAAVARDRGFTDIREGGGDAVELAHSLIRARPQGDVAYLCGKVRLPHFEKLLADAGLKAVAIETYDTVVVDRPAEWLVDAVGGQSLDYALIYSANAARSFAEAIDRSGSSALFETTTLVCISPRVADAFGPGLGGKKLVAEEPTETSLLTLLAGAAKNAG
jgi:uroporphyrinogen-III synthase